MKVLLSSLLVFFTAIACNSNNFSNSPSADIVDGNVSSDDTTTNFFPVTSYLKGEIYTIKNNGVSPIKKTTMAGKTDSVWLKMEEIEFNLAAFLSPIIDTANLKSTFQEKKFLDQTLNAFTFTYSPRSNRSNTFAFNNWDVYVDPESSKVRRIYLLKKESDDTTLQLTWLSGKYCKIVTIKNNSVVKEEKISWSFD